MIFMRDDYKEQLSALVDDELRRDESRFLAARVGHEDAARQCVGRYTLIRHALDRSLAVGTDGSSRTVADGVAQALAAEPTHDAGKRRGWRQRAQPIAGLAVAAGVAALTIGLWPQTGTGPSDVRTNPIEAATTGERAPGGTQTVADTQGEAPLSSTAAADNGSDRLEKAARERLTSYMVNHSEHAASGGVGGMLTYVRIAGHDGDE